MDNVKSGRILLSANLALLAVLLLAFAFSPSKEALTHVGPAAPAWLQRYIEIFPYGLLGLGVATAWAIHVRSLNAMRVCALLVFLLTAVLTTAADTLDSDTLHVYGVLTGAFFALALYGRRGIAFNAVFVICATIGVTLLTAWSSTNEIGSIVYVRAFLADPPLVALMAFFATQIRTQLDNALSHEIALRQEAETALSFKTSLLSMTAHDLRAPLNLIINGAKMLRLGLYKGGQAAEESQKPLLSRIESSGQASAHQVEQLLTASKLEADTAEPEHERVSGEAIQAIAESYRELIESKGLCYEVRICLRDGVVTDVVRVGAILKNLIENAVKFTDKGNVRLSCKDDLDGGWSLEVSDTGVGIPAERFPHLFQPFVQGEADHRGLGLGLYIVKMDVDRLRGQIELHSKVGEGTTFKIVVSPRI